MSDGLSPRIMARGGALCLVAGYVDAIGYTKLGGVFAANMTGNTVLLAIAAGQGDPARVTNYATTLAAFLAGATAAALLGRMTGRPTAAFLAAAALILAAAFEGLRPLPSLALLAIAMGLQGAAITRFGSAAMQTVVVTATIIRLAHHVAAAAIPSSGEAQASAARLDALAWIAYGAGAAFALLMERVLQAPLFLAAIALFAIALEVATATGPAPPSRTAA
jgi:uncharacterized membrane protein YoaK (UPF0700 family)